MAIVRLQFNYITYVFSKSNLSFGQKLPVYNVSLVVLALVLIF